VLVQAGPGDAAVIPKVGNSFRAAVPKRTRFVLPKLESYVPTDGIDTTTQQERRFSFLSDS
jgi:hypothetical protein